MLRFIKHTKWLAETLYNKVAEYGYRSSRIWKLYITKWQNKAGVAQLAGRRPVHRKAAGSIPGQAICPGLGLDSW